MLIGVGSWANLCGIEEKDLLLFYFSFVLSVPGVSAVPYDGTA